MHEMLTIVTNVRGVSLSVTWPKSAAARAVYAACRVRGVIWYSLRQIPLASCNHSCAIYSASVLWCRRLKTEIDHYAQAVVSAGGSVTWIQPAVYVVRCRHEFRGNSWLAGFQLGSWTYDDQLMDLQPLPLPLGSARPGQEDDNEVDVDVDSFSSNDHWAMLDHAGRREVRKVACCEDPRLDAHYGRHQSPNYVSLHYLLKLRKKLGPSLLGRRRRK